MEAKKLVEDCSDSYRASTSSALAKSFSDRALKLNESIRLWVTGLALSLCSAAYIGYQQIEFIKEFLKIPEPSWSTVIVKLFITAMSIGPTIWFAWLATKQIGQRFKIAEDYEFKASVAKSYEGYRREAARINPELEERLLKSLLDKIDEEPIRFVETQTPGSPAQEWLSPIMKDAQSKIAQAGENLTNMMKPSVKITSNDTIAPRSNPE